MASILFWFPHAIHQQRMGSQQVAWRLLNALVATGHDIHFATGTYPPGSGMDWDAQGHSTMREIGVKSVHVQRSFVDDIFGLCIRKLDERTGRVRPIGSWAYAPPMQRRWFRDRVRAVGPDLLLTSYSASDALVRSSGFDRSRCILDLPDLLLVNKAMRRFLSSHLPPGKLHPQRAPESILDLGCFQGIVDRMDPSELQACSKYGRVLAISRREANLVERAGGKVEHLPVCMPAVPLDNSRQGMALLATGPNAFNAQGYLWFAARVLPGLLRTVPQFQLGVTGSLSKSLDPIPGVTPLGFLPRLADAYQEARFAICPVFGGTGQQVKIVEAMAHGVPVVALGGPAQESPIRHGENGFVCSNADEFVQACATLWNDERLRHAMGEAARATVAAEASEPILLERVARVVREVLTRTGRNSP